MKKPLIAATLGFSLLLGACNGDSTANNSEEVIEEVKTNYAELDGRMLDFIMASETRQFETMYELVSEQDKALIETDKASIEYLISQYSTNPMVAKQVLQANFEDNAYEITRFTLFEDNGIILYEFEFTHALTGITFVDDYVSELVKGKWEIRYLGSADHESPYYEPYVESDKLTGGGLSRIIKDYPSFAEVLVSKEQSKMEYLEANQQVKDLADELIQKEW
ncbi:hypothetical protein SAMN05880501_11311 [Ureibacillus xyleni]|uniref:Uncharacterized protein n=1 Tax=Ureibacillus xyleni TaxID=614648 RepID=A0A285THL9_9BACL|nr:hypothetical protein [Ureibacillus xyleni]SOC21542.1 hypothetical protein SAMN05880501_11311 [Ureibacillus xyleni]